MIEFKSLAKVALVAVPLALTAAACETRLGADDRSLMEQSLAASQEARDAAARAEANSAAAAQRAEAAAARAEAAADRVERMVNMSMRK